MRSRPETAWETFAHDADIGVRGFGATMAEAFAGAAMAEAFAGAAMAMTSAICDPARVGAGDTVRIECTAADAEMLLVDWLNALVYEMATRRMLFSRFEVAIEDERAAAGAGRGKLCLRATVRGEPVDVPRHQPAAEAKGASFCELAVRQEAEGRWSAQCVVDV